MRMVLRIVVVVAVLVAVLMTAYRLARAPWLEWNDPRMARSAVVLYGHGLYDSEGEGPRLANIHGPYSALFYVPAAMIASTPSGAIWLGSVASFLIVMLPVLWLLTSGSRVRSTTTIGAFAIFWLFLFHNSMFAPFGIHADQPALGFGALACALALSRRDETSAWEWLFPASLVALSVGSKQPMVALPIGIALYVGLIRGRTAAAAFLYSTAAAGVVALLLIAPLADLRTLLFSAVVVPASQPWRGAGGVAALVASFRDLAPRVLPAVLILGGVGALEIVAGRLRVNNVRDWARKNGWVLLLTVGLVNIPMALVGRAKIGGSMNALSISAYFLYVAAAMALAQTACQESRRLGSLGIMPVRTALGTILVALTAWTVPSVREIGDIRSVLAQNPEKAAFTYARTHQERAFFPFNPLITLMSEGRAYHFSGALYDLNLAGFGLDTEQFRRWIPSELEVVLVPATRREYGNYALQFLPEYGRRRVIPDLPGWDAWVAVARPPVTRR